MENVWLQPGSLLSMATQASERALRSGDLKHIDTELSIYTEADISFQIRVLSNLDKKTNAGKELESLPHGEKLLQQAASIETNPFLPFEQQMFVCDLSESRAMLLNKFNVVNNHLLIITKHFEDQRSPLSKVDFYGLSVAMREFPALAFYNAGKEAGASQKHRHIQILPKAELGAEIPISPSVLNNTLFSFRYCLISGLQKDSEVRSEQLWKFYNRSIDELSLKRDDGFLKPYNLLVCGNWAIIIPRSKESANNISINSLGFAGLFLVKNQTQIADLQTHGVLKTLADVAVPK